MKNLLYSTIIGDICGSVYEFSPERNYSKINLTDSRSDFTDDTVCTLAVADALMSGKTMADATLEWCRRYPGRGYGGMFLQWLRNGGGAPYNSFGNGSAMRCSAVGFSARSANECIHLATASAHFTHNHPEGIKGAVATALCIYHLMEGKDKEFIRENVLRTYYPHYADAKLNSLRPSYRFNETCQETVPQSILCFLESNSFEDCLKLCYSMGGDADTMGAIAAPMAYAFYRHIPNYLIELADDRLPKEMTAACRRFDRFADEIKGRPRVSRAKIITLDPNEVFVFGSNLRGMHNGGAARYAMDRFGAEPGTGVGMTGRCYAIPTMQGGVETIVPYVNDFFDYARNHPELKFLVTRIGCGIAGFKDTDIAPLFKTAYDVTNVLLPATFWDILDYM